MKTEIEKVTHILFHEYSWNSKELDNGSFKIQDVMDATKQALNIASVSGSVWVVRDTHMGQIHGMFTTQQKAIKYCGDGKNLSITNMSVE